MTSVRPSPLTSREDYELPLTREAVALDLAFHVGLSWSTVPGRSTARVMDYVGGTRGMHVRIAQWALEFIAHWNALPTYEQYDYAAEIELFALSSIEQLLNAVDVSIVATKH
jgi:hypothetical protein